MIRVLLLALLLAVGAFPSQAMPFLRGGAAPAAACPTGNPSPDGSAIFPVATGQTSCTLNDVQGFAWQFQGDTLYSNGGGGWIASSRPLQFQVNSGGKAYAQNTCASYQLWFQNSSNGLIAPVISPTQANPQNPYWDTTRGLSFVSFYAMVTSGSVLTGDALEFKPLPPGLPIWAGGGRITVSNLTLTIDSGSVIGCSGDPGEGNAVIPVDTGGGPVSGLTVQGAGATLSEIAFYHDTVSGAARCINEGNGSNWIVRDLYIHDCDFGMQGNTQPAGTTGAITNVVFDHNGASSAGGASATHNVYLGSYTAGNTSILTVSGGGSYCTNGTDGGGPGFHFKTRWVGGTFQNWTAAEPSQHGYSDCGESANVDLSCGGHYALGGATAGQGIVLELANGIKTNGNEFIRYGRDDTTGNCGAGGTPWPDSDCSATFGANCLLLVQNCWIINDTNPSVQLSVVTIDATIPAGRTTVKNCKIVGNVVLGTGVADGGGNTFYADRTAAGLSAYPALPSPP